MYINICTNSPEAMPIAGGRLKVYMHGCTFADMATHTGSKKSMNTKKHMYPSLYTYIHFC